MYEKPEGEDGMTNNDTMSKHNESNVVRKGDDVRQEQTDQLLKVPGYKLIGDEQDPHGDDGGHDVSNVEKTQQAVRKNPTSSSPLCSTRSTRLASRSTKARRSTCSRRPRRGQSRSTPSKRT